MSRPSDTQFTGLAPTPRADRFRLGDVWRGPNGISYLVHRGIAQGAVTLKPIEADRARTGVRILHLRATSCGGLTRIKWGGQP